MTPASPYAWIYLDPRFPHFCTPSDTWPNKKQADSISIPWPTERQLADALADAYDEMRSTTEEASPATLDDTSISWPTEKQLVDALADVYDEGRLGTVDDAYHDTLPDMELRCGIEDGPEYRMKIAEGHRHGLISYSKFADWNEEIPLWCHQKDNVPYETALEWWLMLVQGQYDLLEERIQAWTEPERKRWSFLRPFGKG